MSNRVERFGARPGVPLGGARAGVAEEVAQREAVDAFARERAGERVALVVEAKAARDARDCLGGLEVAFDRALAVRSSFRREEDVLAHDGSLAARVERCADLGDDREEHGAFRLAHDEANDACAEVDARPFQQPQVGASQSGVEREDEEGLAPLQALEGERDEGALRVGRLVLALPSSRECGRGEVLAEPCEVVEGAEEGITLVGEELVLHDRLGQERELLAQGIVAEDAAPPGVLEDLAYEVETRIDRRVAVRALVAVGLALHRADEIFEVRDRELVEAHVAERRQDVMLQQRVVVLSLCVGEAAADALPRRCDVAAQRGRVARKWCCALRVLDGISECRELRFEVVPALHDDDLTDALVSARARHAALEDRFLRSFVVGLQAGRSHE